MEYEFKSYMQVLPQNVQNSDYFPTPLSLTTMNSLKVSVSSDKQTMNAAAHAEKYLSRLWIQKVKTARNHVWFNEGSLKRWGNFDFVWPVSLSLHHDHSSILI